MGKTRAWMCDAAHCVMYGVVFLFNVGRRAWTGRTNATTGKAILKNKQTREIKTREKEALALRLTFDFFSVRSSNQPKT